MVDSLRVELRLSEPKSDALSLRYESVKKAIQVCDMIAIGLTNSTKSRDLHLLFLYSVRDSNP